VRASVYLVDMLISSVMVSSDARREVRGPIADADTQSMRLKFECPGPGPAFQRFALPPAWVFSNATLERRDNAINLDIATEALQFAGADVDSAPSGGEALTLLASKAYDLVVLDLAMPEMDGLAVGRALRGSDKKPTSPFWCSRPQTPPKPGRPCSNSAPRA